MCLSRIVSETDGDSSQKLQIFPTPCILCPAEGVPLEMGIGTRGQKTRMMELSDGRKSFKIGLLFRHNTGRWTDSKDRTMQSVVRVISGVMNKEDLREERCG